MRVGDSSSSGRESPDVRPPQPSSSESDPATVLLVTLSVPTPPWCPGAPVVRRGSEEAPDRTSDRRVGGRRGVSARRGRTTTDCNRRGDTLCSPRVGLGPGRPPQGPYPTLKGLQATPRKPFPGTWEDTSWAGAGSTSETATLTLNVFMRRRKVRTRFLCKYNRLRHKRKITTIL